MGSMKRFYMLFAVAGLAILAAGCAAPAKVDTSKDEAAIRAVFDNYCSALKAGDFEGWLALWDEGGVRLPPGGPMETSVAEIRRDLGGIADLKNVDYSMTITTQEVLVFPAEGYGMARGLFREVFQERKPGSKAEISDGKFMTMFKKQPDGSWKIFRDSFNLNAPAS